MPSNCHQYSREHRCPQSPPLSQRKRVQYFWKRVFFRSDSNSLDRNLFGQIGIVGSESIWPDRSRRLDVRARNTIPTIPTVPTIPTKDPIVTLIPNLRWLGEVEEKLFRLLLLTGCDQGSYIVDADPYTLIRRGRGTTIPTVVANWLRTGDPDRPDQGSYIVDADP